MVDFPYHIAHVFAMLALHPTHDIATAGIGRAHEVGNGWTERGGHAGGVVPVYAQEKLPE